MTSYKFCSCSEDATVYNDPDRQYSWVIFLNETDSSGSYPHTTKQQFVYQSKFPPYVHRYESEGEEYVVICGYVNGEDSMRITANWEHSNGNPSELYVHDGYIRQCKISVNDNVSRDRIGFNILECYPNNGVDNIRVISTFSGFVSITSEGSHYGMVGRNNEHLKLYTRTSGSFGNPTSPVLAPTRFPTEFRIGSSQYYVTSSPFGSQDYRLIQWEPFQTGDAWLAWCQAHSG